jgi:hypothetical protein
MTRLLVAVLVAWAVASSLLAQQAATPTPAPGAAADADTRPQEAASAAATRLVRGVVVRAADDAPLGRVRITATRARTQLITASVLTDARGEFALTVPAGTALSLRVQKAGYATTTLPIAPARAGVPTDLHVSLARGAVITGRVIFDTGSRIFSGVLRLTVRRLSTGADSSDSGTNTLTIVLDDRGEYRVSGLVAGRYAIGTHPGNAFTASLRIPPVVVDVPEGAELAGIDVVVESPPPVLTSPPVPAVRPAGGAVIRGRVTGTSGDPLAVSVSVVAGSRRISATSGADGRYAVTGVPAGTITVESTTNGYVRSLYGSRDAQLPGLPIAVKDNQEIDGIDLVLARTSAVSGTVVDEAGEPIEGASVQLLRVLGMAPGVVQVPPPPDPLLTSSQPSDDRGRFRISGAAPGSYLLVATIAGETGGAAGGARFGYVPAYYPGTPDPASAARLTIGAEQDLSGFTIPIARVPVVRIQGIATDSAGRPLTGQVRLSRARAPGVAQQPRQSLAGPNGEFAFNDVRPGDYVVHATTGTGPSGPEFAALPITLGDTDPPPVLLRSAPGSRVSGRLVLEGSPDAVLWGYSSTVVPMDLALSATASATRSGAFSTGETFILSGLGGTARLVFTTPDDKWFLKSILLDGADIADRPFEFGVGGRAYTDVEVVFSPNVASIEGRVTDERGLPVPHHAVIVFGAERATWFAGSRWAKMARGQSDGTFKVTALPPGDYFVAAVDRLEESGEWQDPDFLQTMASSAVRVTLGERQAQTTTLRIIRR